MEKQLKTPIAFIIFNRPDCTVRVFELIRKARPEKLYLIADGPRPHKPGEAERCAETRRIVEQMIDWPCDVQRNYAETNLGCRKRIITGLRWVFEQEEEAIILEDDIVPDPTFFEFCSAMLEQYRNDDRVMQVAGFNEIGYRPRDGADCFLSRYTYIWGWATWRRAWNLYQSRRTNLEADIELIYKNRRSRRDADLLIHHIKEVEVGKLDTWDYHWRVAILANNGLSLTPSRNLVQNIGFGPRATHTISPFNLNRFKRCHPLPPPYRTPEKTEEDTLHDRRVQLRHAVTYRVERIKDLALQHLPGRKDRACGDD